MTSKKAQFGGRTALFIGLSLGAASTMAGYDVYIWDQCYAMEQSLRID